MPLDGFGPNFADGVCGIRNRTQSFVDNPLGLCIRNGYTDFGFKTKKTKAFTRKSPMSASSELDSGTGAGTGLDWTLG